MSEIVLSESETSFKLEGRLTNLLVWKDSGFIYMRIDCCKQYDVPLTKETIKYLNKENDVINELLKLGEFEYPEQYENEIISLLSKLKQRKNHEW